MSHTILLLEDEPLILMDLEYAAQDLGCAALITSTIEEALVLIGEHRAAITVAVLDVSLGEGKTCIPVAHELERLGIPFILHTGDLNRHDETMRALDAQLVAKPAPAEKVIAAAVAHAFGNPA